MAWYRETLLLGDGALLDARVERDQSYRLSLSRSGAVLVEYSREGGVHRRRVQGRTAEYAFRSIEQLRYDFEQDAEDALRPG